MRKIATYGLSFLWNLDRWIKPWIKLHRHKRSLGRIIMHRRICLIFKVVVVFASPSIRSGGRELQRVTDRDGYCYFSQGQCDPWNQQQHMFCHLHCVVSSLLFFLSFSPVLSHNHITLYTHYTSRFSPWSTWPLCRFCNWPCYSHHGCWFHCSPVRLKSALYSRY